MSGAEIGFLSLVIAAVVIFSIALAWASARSSGR